MSVEIKNISKSFGKTQALKDVTLTFEDGMIYGLLGRNGAGKSTLLNIITNRIFASSGEVLIDGENAEENDNALSKVYIMSDATLYPKDFKIKELFKWSKEFYKDFDITLAEKYAEKFGLDTNKRVKSLSTGFTSIYKLVIALSVNTPYLFLDEPVLGLDANNRELFYSLLIEKYAEEPFTIVISTHLIEEISSFIEHAIIIDNGEIIMDKSRDELLAMGYAVSGTIGDVNEYIVGKEVIGEDNLGGLKTAYIFGAPDYNVPESIEITKLDLQKLFVKLTNAKEENR